MTVLVSGATGFLGPALLRALDEPIVAVLRGDHHRDRARHLARRTGCDLRSVRGDVSMPGWGLDPGELAVLRGEVRTVINLAGEVRWSAPWHRLAAVNIQGARHSVDVAHALGVPLVHASSIFVGFGYADEVPEALLDERGNLSKYERSKLRGEWMVARRSTELSVSAVIARIPALSGDLEPPPGVRSGAQQVPFSRMLARSRWPVVPFGPAARLDLCPRDLVAGRLSDLAGRSPDGRPEVRNLGFGAHAPLVGALLREAAASADPQGFPRPVPVAARWLMRASRAADRLDESPRSTALVGLRYFASPSLFVSSGLAREVSLRTLVRTLGLPHRPATVDTDPYYLAWPS